MFRGIIVCAVMCLTLVSWSGARGDDQAARSPDVTEPPDYEEFLVLPLRIHVLTATELPEANCRLSDADVLRILAKVNRIWNKAGIHWGLESLLREPAARQGIFRALRGEAAEGNLLAYRLLFPRKSRAAEAMNLYYIHEFPVNGLWLGGEAIVQDAAQLRSVDGGSDEPIPRVSAHELGHELGLEHRADNTNLLAPGTTGILLNAAEVKTARATAREDLHADPVAVVRKRAEAAEASGDRNLAGRLWTWLAEIPGAGAELARVRRDRLDPPTRPAAAADTGSDR